MRQYLQRVLARGRGRDLLPWLVLAIWLLAAGSGGAPQNPNPPEIQAHEGQEAPPTFQLHVERNLVTVKVVVRDRNDHLVGNLHQEDFRLSDDGKPQDILGFTMETGNPTPAPEASPSAPTPTEKTTEAPPAPAKTVAQRFVILYFDDFHLEQEAVGRTRDAAWRYVNTAVRPQDRVAIFTATGKDQIDFTEDREKLHDALFRLAAKPRVPNACPQIDDYEAFQITQQAPDALAIAHVEAIRCDCGGTDPGKMQPIDPMTERSALLMGAGGGSDPCPLPAEQRVEREAAQIWDLANIQSQYSLQGIEIAVRRLAAMPGQRSLVLVSPGFLTQTQSSNIDDITNRALQQDVVISAIAAAGLAPRNMHNFIPGRPDLEVRKTTIENFGTIAAQDVMAGLSAATGGVFYHNSNDFDAGFQQAAAVPEVYYVLTFSPPNVKLDGKFHSLKVTLNTRDSYTVQARRGYFASASGLAGQASGMDELEKMVFSQEEIHGLPAEVAAQAAKLPESKSKLTVSIHVDIRQLQFRKEADRNVDKLIFHTTLFDRDGKYVAAKEASLDLHLKDATLAKFTQSGINAKTSFEVAPGTYRVREIVRDTESKALSALNYVVEVPGQ
jgi:VWFA-related protein